MTTRYAEVHKNPQGPGDARPTALQIVQDENLTGQMTNKTILITGASSGIGIDTAKALFATNATLYLAARSLDKAKVALGPDLMQSPRVHLLELDLSSLRSVRACAAQFLSQSQTLNILIANAGVMAPPEGRTEDGFETQFGTNHLGHFLLFQLLKPALLAAASPEDNGRVVVVASSGHRWSEVLFDNYNLEGEYEPFKAYGQSKTANIWMANEIDRLYGSRGLRAFSLHPGGIESGLQQHLPEEQWAGFRDNKEFAVQWKSPEQGAATTVWAAISKSLDGLGGKYLEDVQIANPVDPAGSMYSPGYAPHAYSPEKEKRLWDLSLKLVGM
ncbi:hypothetical protein FE257_005065 [Aspergillus nanangensis]|uniref:Short-chain dehydrogenase n=1 Tax=Aspergillus nanangensis TaxID=2582783 RepID=A0AAD4CR26_ASPNN|nr:hypothetical protein FE257_005065 [Aspergillus nanangensis]